MKKFGITIGIFIVAVGIMMSAYTVSHSHQKEVKESVHEYVDFTQYMLGDLGDVMSYSVGMELDLDEIMEPGDKKAQKVEFQGEPLLIVYENTLGSKINSYNAKVTDVLTINDDGSTEEFLLDLTGLRDM